MPEIAEAVVIVVEDDLMNATLIKKMLQIVGVGKVIVCESGEEVRRLVVDMPRVDLILLDLRIPEEDGFEIFSTLRYLPSLKATRIVAATANIMPTDISEAEKLGFDGFLGKPFVFDRFRSQIARLLNGERVWEPR